MKILFALFLCCLLIGCKSSIKVDPADVRMATIRYYSTLRLNPRTNKLEVLSISNLALDKKADDFYVVSVDAQDDAGNKEPQRIIVRVVTKDDKPVLQAEPYDQKLVDKVEKEQ